MQQRFRKYIRDPAAIGVREITPRHWEMATLIEAFPFLPTQTLLDLNGGDRMRSADRLTTLYREGIVNRFYFPRTLGNPGPFHYFIDHQATITELGRLNSWTLQKRDLAKAAAERNRRNGYSKLNDPIDSRDIINKTLFLQHEAMISRFHARLELAARATGGEVRLVGWAQGPLLEHKVPAPKLEYSADMKRWSESDEIEHLPHEPDAYFVLHFPNRAPGNQYAHYLYEADRETMNVNRMNKKFRAHFHYIIKKRLYKEHYGIARFRAVVVETLSDHWANHLRTHARHPIVSGHKPTPLFYFGSLTSKNGQGRGLFDRVWRTAVDNQPWSLLDERPNRY